MSNVAFCLSSREEDPDIRLYYKFSAVNLPNVKEIDFCIDDTLADCEIYLFNSLVWSKEDIIFWISTSLVQQRTIDIYCNSDVAHDILSLLREKFE
jgi:hypothetical protein